MHNCLILKASLIIFFGLVIVGCGSDSESHDENRHAKQRLGERLFNDTRLSEPQGLACASCHNELIAFSDPDHNFPTSEGAKPGIFGRRQALSLKYLKFTPPLSYDGIEDLFFGGFFWDGRVDSLEQQAEGPLLSPKEMNNASKAALVEKVQNTELEPTFREVFGEEVFSDSEVAFKAIAEALAAYERTEEFSPFSSRYDEFLEGKVEFTEQEKRGLELFNSPRKGNCAACHPSTGADGHPALFTDFTYDNLGVPRNSKNPFYHQPASINPDGANFVDYGQGVTTGRLEDLGKQKVPTLRNIAITAPYFHNGVFDDLETVVQFYNKRDTGEFGPPEVGANVNRDELGNLGLNDQEVRDIVAFLKTLTDEAE